MTTHTTPLPDAEALADDLAHDADFYDAIGSDSHVAARRAIEFLQPYMRQSVDAEALVEKIFKEPQPARACDMFDGQLWNYAKERFARIIRQHTAEQAAKVPVAEPGDFISGSCGGERCSICGEPAAKKVGEEIQHDDPYPYRHNLTAYVCKAHFDEIMDRGGYRKRESNETDKLASFLTEAINALEDCGVHPNDIMLTKMKAALKQADDIAAKPTIMGGASSPLAALPDEAACGFCNQRSYHPKCVHSGEAAVSALGERMPPKALKVSEEEVGVIIAGFNAALKELADYAIFMHTRGGKPAHWPVKAIVDASEVVDALSDEAAPDICHICGIPNDQPGSPICSGAHPRPAVSVSDEAAPEINPKNETIENLIGEAYQLAGQIAAEIPGKEATKEQKIKLLDILAYDLPDALENEVAGVDAMNEKELHTLIYCNIPKKLKANEADALANKLIEVLRFGGYLRTSQPAPLSSNHLDHVRESLRGAASDCHVSLQPDQVRYITKAVLDAAGVPYVD